MDCIQGTLQRDDGRPLGTLASVRQSLLDVFPGIAFEWSPSGPEKLARIDAQAIALPEMVRRVLEQQPSVLCGGVESESYVAGFNLGAGGPVDLIWVQVEGDVDRLSACWEILRLNTGWKLNLEVGSRLSSHNFIGW